MALPLLPVLLALPRFLEVASGDVAGDVGSGEVAGSTVGLSGGAIFGIVVGSLVLTLLVVFVVLYLFTGLFAGAKPKGEAKPMVVVATSTYPHARLMIAERA
jgi:hypothetical protein